MKHLLQYFTELSLHPKNAEELKGLILQLAVQGKLTAKWREENPDVEPASVLLERIKEEKARLVKEKKLKTEKPLPRITENEIPFELPESWVWCRLGDLNYNIHYGYTASAEKTFENIRLLRITDIQDNTVNWNTVPDCVIDEKKFPIYELKENDILIARTGGTIGKSYLVKGVSVKSVFASYLIRAIPVNEVYAEYEKLFIETPFYWQQLKANSQGTGQPNVNATALKGLAFSLPPLEEQKAIVKTVNQLFTEVEQLETLTQERIQLKEDFVTSALHQLQTGDTVTEWAFLQQHFSTFFTEESNIKKLRESILQLAVQGKLTHLWRKENPEVEPASVLLERIKEEKAQLVKEKKLKTEKPLPGITEDEIPLELPESWVWCRLGDLNYNIHYGYTASAEKTFENIRLLRITDIQDNTVNWNTVPDCVIDEKKFPTYELKENDILIARTGGTIGKSYLVKGVSVKSVFASYLIRAIPVNEVYAEYEKLFIETPFYWQQLKANSQGTGQPNVNATALKGLAFSLPPLEEQKAIVEKVNTLLALCDQLEQAIQTSKATQEDWMKSSLREVFERETETINN